MFLRPKFCPSLLDNISIRVPICNVHHHHHHHHHLALQPYVSLVLLCYSPPLVSILSFPSPICNVRHYKQLFASFKNCLPARCVAAENLVC
jgi:hypothetical protein